MSTLAVIASEDFGLNSLTVENGLTVPSVIHVDGELLPQDVKGLFIYAPNGTPLRSDISKAVEDALLLNIPILASAVGMNRLNIALGGDDPEDTVAHTLKNDNSRERSTVFLAPGSKVSSTIGGSGWVGVACDHDKGVPQARLSPELMVAAMADDRIVEAFEMPGRKWVVGVQWDVFGANRLPRGFDAIWIAFMERVTGC